MATKRQKKEEAKQRIRDVVPTFPIPKTAPPLLRALNLVTRGAEVGGQALVELDPLGIITDDPVIRPAQDTTPAFQRMVNDPAFKLSPDMVDLVNNDNRMLVSDGTRMMEVNSNSNQFSGAAVLPSSNKRTRKKTKTDKLMSKALEEANKRLRTKKGKLRKGKTQADVMRLAHRIRRKMI